VALTPIQRWFFELDLPRPHHFNQSVMLEASGPVDVERLRAVAAALLRHHDALRLRFERDPGGWRAALTGPPPEAPLIVADLSAATGEELDDAVQDAAARVQAGLHLASGPLFMMGLLARGGGRPPLVLVVAHHLVIDGVSWRVLLEDLETAWTQSGRGEPIRLPPKTTSFRCWAERLLEHARSGDWTAERGYWWGLPEISAEETGTVAEVIPVDHPGGVNREDSTSVVMVSLSAEETAALLKETPRAYRTGINDVLLTALALAFADWTGSSRLDVDLEGHGREDLWSDVDVSRTVGWFTALYPVRLTIDGEDPGNALRSIKEQIRKVPGRGLGYGLLRYLGDPGGREALHPRVSFNYLGQFGGGQGDPFFRPARESTGPNRAPDGVRPHLIDVNGIVAESRLHLAWTFSRNVHREATIERLAGRCLDRLKALIEHCRSAGEGGVTPSDFPLAGLDEEKLRQLSELIAETDETAERS
jgi:non-ribosomal peptide synthase protein (TIGR01720 family)